MKGKMVTLPLAELVEDLSVYPRHAVDDAHVRSLELALEAGHDLPPPVADEKSKVIVDGWHRCRAHKRHFGPTATLAVELRHYKDRKSMLEDAVALNACHGRKLDEMDRVRAVRMLQEEGVAVQRIAVVMNMTEKRIEVLAVRVAVARGPAVDSTVPGTREVVLKRPVMHMRGKTLTHEQARVCDSMPGTSFMLIANQLRMALETDLLDRSDERLVAAVLKLADVIRAKLAA